MIKFYFNFILLNLKHMWFILFIKKETVQKHIKNNYILRLAILFAETFEQFTLCIIKQCKEYESTCL